MFCPDARLPGVVTADWAVAMQMSEGNPQVVAFAVRDPAAEGTDEGPRVSVTSRRLDDAGRRATARLPRWLALPLRLPLALPRAVAELLLRDMYMR